MTLKQAFTIWSNMSNNIVLAAKSHAAVQRVLMKKWSDIELEQITTTFARKVFTQSSEVQEMKTKAASILVHILNWGAENGHCKCPTFDYTIANDDEPKKTEPIPVPKAEEPIVKVRPGAPAKRKAELAAREEPKKDITMEQDKTTKRGRTPRPFAQIDPQTFEVVKVWPTMKEAERALGACNIDRAARLLRKSAGFYWSDAADAATFEKRMDAKTRGFKPVQQKPEKKGLVDKFNEEQQMFEQMKKEKKVVVEQKPAVAPKPEEQQINTAARDALEVFTDDELLAELDRRGWQGEIRKIQIVSIGVK
jgi:hypothetical protein